MSTSLPKRRGGAVPPRATVERIVRAVYKEADRAVTGACAALKAVGLDPRVPVPLDLMLELGAMMRIYEWEEAELTQFLSTTLPSAERVMQDILRHPLGGGAEVGGRDLARRVFGTWYRQFAFDHVEPGAEVVINGVDPAAVVAQLAEFLWNHRRLAAALEEN